MIKVSFPTPGRKVTVEVECSGPKEVFEAWGTMAEVFSDATCGCCKSETIYARVRKEKNKDNKDISYYEMVCSDCHARLSFGQLTDTIGLWPKRKTEDKTEWLPDRGWSVYKKPSSNEAAPGARNGHNGAAPPPPPAGREDEALKGLLKDPSDSMGELCETLRERGGEDLCNRAWQQANQGTTDPATIVRRLYAVVKGG